MCLTTPVRKRFLSIAYSDPFGLNNTEKSLGWRRVGSSGFAMFRKVKRPCLLFLNRADVVQTAQRTVSDCDSLAR
jgi:hypothetical protein